MGVCAYRKKSHSPQPRNDLNAASIANTSPQTSYELNLAELWFTGACESGTSWKVSSQKTKERERETSHVACSGQTHHCHHHRCSPSSSQHLQRPTKQQTQGSFIFSPHLQVFAADKSNISHCEVPKTASMTIKDNKKQQGGQNGVRTLTACLLSSLFCNTPLAFWLLYSWQLGHSLKTWCYKWNSTV